MYKLLQKIEALREELKEMVTTEKGFVDQEVVKKSQELDELLNDYARLLQDKENK